VLPDSAIIAAAVELPTDRSTLLSTKGFHGRGAERYASRWLAALKRAAEMPEDELPTRAPRSDGPPTPRAWAERDPVAARRLALAKDAVTELSERVNVPVENLLTPDFMRRTLWTPPSTRKPGDLIDDVTAQLSSYGARGWQIALTAPLLTSAILDADT
jgi:ribonuclease D